METVRSWTARDLERLDEMIVEGERRFKERQPRSRALIGEAREVLAGGATSSWQIARPQMIWVSHGEGSKIFDADGGEYVDLHGGYGVGAVGHGHPKIVEAVSGRAPRGTHFAQPTEDAIVVAGRVGEAVRVTAVAVFQLRDRGDHGCCPSHAGDHGAGSDRQGGGLLPRAPRLAHGLRVQRGGRDRAPRPPPQRALGNGDTSGYHRSHPHRALQRPDALERLFAEHRGRIAGMILEPIMMNAGVIPPDRAISRACARSPTSTVPCSPSTRSSVASPPPTAGPPGTWASAPTWCASPKRWVAASLAGPSVGPRRSWAASPTAPTSR